MIVYDMHVLFLMMMHLFQYLKLHMVQNLSCYDYAILAIESLTIKIIPIMHKKIYLIMIILTQLSHFFPIPMFVMVCNLECYVHEDDFVFYELSFLYTNEIYDKLSMELSQHLITPVKTSKKRRHQRSQKPFFFFGFEYQFGLFGIMTLTLTMSR